MNTSRYVLLGSIAAILIALIAWYLFIRAQQDSIEQDDAARGGESAAPLFGGSIGSTYENIVSSIAGLVGEEGSDGSLPQLSQVTKTPVAGFGFVGNATSTRLRFVERSTGHIIEVDPRTGSLARLTNTTVPRIYEAIVAGTSTILRTTDTSIIRTSVGIITASSTEPEVGGALSQKSLPDNIRSLAVSRGGTSLFYSLERADGVDIYHATPDGSKPERVFSSGLRGWRLYPSENKLVIAQHPSDGVLGYAYTLENGTLTPLVPGGPGLTILPHPSSGALIYGTSGGGLSLYARGTEDSTATLLPIRTIADKCVWSPASPLTVFCAVPQGTPPLSFLDGWSRGEAHTSDAWWRVNTSAASAELAYSPGNTEFDVEGPIMDSAGRYIAFSNARDRSLWLLRIQE